MCRGFSIKMKIVVVALFADLDRIAENLFSKDAI